MKKIINGKSYDTTTAKRLAFWCNDGGWNDFNHVEETLYKKKTGEYFLFGEGGPATRYAERVDTNSWSGGSRIMPMTYKEAAAWAEEHLSGDEYEEIFGKVVEDESRKTVTYSLSVGTIETIRRLAEQDGVSASEMVEQLVDKATAPVIRVMYSVRRMSIDEIDAELAAVEKRGAAYFTDPILTSSNLSEVRNFLKSLGDPERCSVEIYTVDGDGEFLNGSDYDTVDNFLKRT